MSMLFKRIKDWATSITSFRKGDVIPVDGPDGTAKMAAGLLATHEELEDFSDIVEPIFKGASIDLNDTSLWEQGGIVSNSGNPYATTTRLRTANFIRLCGNVLAHTYNSATTQMYAYTENETFIGSVGSYFNQGALENYVASHPEAVKFKIVVVCNTDVLPAQLATYINFDATNNYTSGRFFGLQKLIENEQASRKTDDATLSASIAEQTQRITDNAGVISTLMAYYYTQLTLTIVSDKYRNAWGTNFTDYTGAAYAVIPVKVGEKYKLSARVGTNIRTYVITNASGTITRAAASETWTTTHNYDVEVTIEENEAYLYINSLGDSYIGIRQEGNYPIKGNVYNVPNSINGDAIKDNSIPQSKIQGGFDANPLFGKVAIFDGDSICHGTAGQSPSDPDYAYGWAGRIGTRNSMTWKNYGISGGTVTANTYSWNKVTTTPDWAHNTYYKRKGRNQSTDVIDQYPVVTEEEWDGTTQLYTKGPARHWESTDITTMHTEYPSADYVILEACLNDAFNAVPFGTLSEGFSETLNASTYYGSFETMLRDAITNFPTAKIGLIIPYRPSADVNDYQDKALEVARKYSIPVLDLRYDSGLCQQNTAQSALLFYDNTHINQDGYDFITPKIEAWMKQL